MANELESLLKQHFPALSEEIRTRVCFFYEFLLKENQIQNLTRLISPEDFIYGHLSDVMELLKLDWISYPAVDIGSGAGIPGLLAAIVHKQSWILVESEKKKADYLKRAVEHLKMDSLVRVYPDRVENCLSKF